MKKENGTLFVFRPDAEVDLATVADSILDIVIEGLRPRRGE